MQFFTKVPIENNPHPIGYGSRIVSLGSCFAENIGKKFDYFKFQNSVNPFGIIFNPVSIEKIIRRAVHKEAFTEHDVFFHNELWHCFDVHSELSHPDKETLLQNLNQQLIITNHQLLEATHIIITLGTAWVYQSEDTGEIVANCHKVPQKHFAKELLSVETIQRSLKGIIRLITTVNATAQFIFTVSPVRHIKDGFVQNQLSKAHLITALHQVSGASYFPSYEIMMDELREYRFYAEDLLHPNQIAIDYIWKRFAETVMAPEIFLIMEEVDSIQKSLLHRPFNPNSESYLRFLEKLKLKMTVLEQKCPAVRF